VINNTEQQKKFMNKAEAEKIANLLEALDKTELTVREGASQSSPKGTGPLSSSTLEGLRSIGQAGSGERIKVNVKLWIDFASE
jgi:hypothetical protein